MCDSSTEQGNARPTPIERTPRANSSRKGQVERTPRGRAR